MKRAKHRIGDAVRYKFGTGGDEATLPLEVALSQMARQLFALAASVIGDEARRQSLQRKAQVYDEWARAAIERKAVAEHVQQRRSAGGTTTAQMRAVERDQRERKLLAAALSILKDEPGMKILPLAMMLAQRGYGGAEAIRKKLSLLLGPPGKRRSSVASAASPSR